MPPESDATFAQEKDSGRDEEEDEFIRQAGWKDLFGFTTRTHLPVLGATIFTATVAALTMPVQTIVYGLIFRQFANFASGSLSSLGLTRKVSEYCLYMTALAAVNWLSNSLYYMLAVTFGELQARSARDRIFEALLKKDLEWYDTRETGIAAILPTIQMCVRWVRHNTLSISN